MASQRVNWFMPFGNVCIWWVWRENVHIKVCLDLLQLFTMLIRRYNIIRNTWSLSYVKSWWITTIYHSSIDMPLKHIPALTTFGLWAIIGCNNNIVLLYNRVLFVVSCGGNHLWVYCLAAINTEIKTPSIFGYAYVPSWQLRSPYH